MRDEEKELSEFLEELSRETDRGLALVAAAIIDHKMLTVLQAFMTEGKVADRLLCDANSPLGTFSSRIDACHALGLIDSFEHHEATLIRKVRNIFAHAKHGTTFSDASVASLCANLKSAMPTNEPKGNPRHRFTNATVCLAIRLIYRDKWVEKERRVEKEWVKADEIGWRSIASEPPPAGKPFVGIGPRGPKLMGE